MSTKLEIDPNDVNRIINGTDIKGDINSKGDVRFDGKLTGNLSTSGKIIIGQSGNIRGEIKCKNADVSGKIEGKIIVTEQLTLKTTSLINGDIVTNKLAIEPGAKFTGTCSMESSQTLPKKKKNQKNNTEDLKNWAKYSGLAFQMGITIAAGTWAGTWLDKKFNTSKPIFSITLILLSVFAAIYFAIKDFIIPKK